MRQYRCEHFKIKELVHPTLLKTISEDILWMMFDERLLKLIDQIRDIYGSTTVNVGNLDSCGLRPHNDADGAKNSPHKFGRAFDLHISSIEKEAQKQKDPKAYKTKAYNKVREELLNDPTFDLLNFELNISWLHVDTYNRKTRTFNP